MGKRTEWAKAYWRKNHKEIAYRRRMSLFDLLGKPICVKCGFNDWRALQIDHIDGGGSKQRKEKVQSLLKSLKNNPEKFQILCANCNWIKRYENAEAVGKPKEYYC